jgi:hypothetical protein
MIDIKTNQAKIKNILVKMLNKMTNNKAKRKNKIEIKRRMMMTTIYLRLRELAIKMAQKLLNGAELKN